MRERETDRQTDRQTDRHRERESQTQTDTDREFCSVKFSFDLEFEINLICYKHI